MDNLNQQFSPPSIAKPPLSVRIFIIISMCYFIYLFFPFFLAFLLSNLCTTNESCNYATNFLVLPPLFIAITGIITTLLYTKIKSAWFLINLIYGLTIVFNVINGYDFFVFQYGSMFLIPTLFHPLTFTIVPIILMLYNFYLGHRLAGFLIASTIIVLLIIGASAYAIETGKNKFSTNYSQHPQSLPTPIQPSSASGIAANWKTYRNEKYAYMFNYPEEKFPNSEVVVNSESLKLLNMWFYKGHYSGVQITVLSSLLKETNIQDPLIDHCNNFKNKTWITVDGNKACKYYSENIFPGREASYEYTAFTVHDKHSYLIIFSGNDKNEVKGNEKLFDQILSTFRFLDQSINPYSIISKSKTSPNSLYIITEEMLGDHNKITIKDKNGKIIVEDLTVTNDKEIGYNIKFACQCGTYFKGWIDDSRFVIKISNGAGEEYEYIVNASTGSVDESTFKKIK